MKSAPKTYPITLYMYALATFFLCLSGTSAAVELDVPYVETPPELVEIMMDLAEIGPDDYVIDLGTGDGRILIAAAKRGAAGTGIDLDPVRIEEAKQNAVDAGVENNLQFIEQDLFETDISKATVITLFLNEEVNLKLRPALLKLKPGTKIVSHMFAMGDWQPLRYQQVLRNNNGNFLIHEVFYWEVPASN
ncbi:MAG: class I SAM-dependent methyltransferase [Gammaproteobacteria bacterium]|nr:class I SAM-dependent methyltransferase [Gammaproteobacteria bacterium]